MLYALFGEWQKEGYSIDNCLFSGETLKIVSVGVPAIDFNYSC